MQRRTWAPVGTFVLVGAVAVAAVTLAGAGRGSGSPAPLRLAGAGERGAATASLTSGTASGYELVGDLPRGRPADAYAWSLTGGAETAVARLATALGEPRPVSERGGWRAGGLAVREDGTWSWSSCAHDLPLPENGTGAGSGEGSTVVVCASTGVVAGGTLPAGPAAVAPLPGLAPDTPVTSGSQEPGLPVATPPPPPPLPSGPAVVSPPLSAVPPPPLSPAGLAAGMASVLNALGLRVEDAHLDPAVGWASLRPRVQGLATSGVETRIHLSPTGELLDATGWIGTPTRGDRYPLLTAAEAFAQLPPRRQALAPCPTGLPCRQPQDAQVMGAELGLMLQQQIDGGSVLVPAWLFAVAESPEPLAVVAVQPRYLGSPEQPTERPTGSPVGPPESAPPGPPATGAPGSPASRELVHIDQAVANAQGVRVAYGESGSCPRRHVTGTAKEDATTVVLLLEADAVGDAPCTADLHLAQFQVELSAPLGSRTLIDGSTGKPVS